MPGRVRAQRRPARGIQRRRARVQHRGVDRDDVGGIAVARELPEVLLRRTAIAQHERRAGGGGLERPERARLAPAGQHDDARAGVRRRDEIRVGDRGGVVDDAHVRPTDARDRGRVLRVGADTHEDERDARVAQRVCEEELIAPRLDRADAEHVVADAEAVGERLRRRRGEARGIDAVACDRERRACSPRRPELLDLGLARADDVVDEAEHVVQPRKVAGDDLVARAARDAVRDQAAVGRGAQIRLAVRRGHDAVEDLRHRARRPRELRELDVARREDDRGREPAQVPELRQRRARLPDIERVYEIVAGCVGCVGGAHVGVDVRHGEGMLQLTDAWWDAAGAAFGCVQGEQDAQPLREGGSACVGSLHRHDQYASPMPCGRHRARVERGTEPSEEEATSDGSDTAEPRR